MVMVHLELILEVIPARLLGLEDKLMVVAVAYDGHDDDMVAMACGDGGDGVLVEVVAWHGRKEEEEEMLVVAETGKDRPYFFWK